MELSISGFSDMLGIDRATVTKRLQILKHVAGPKGAIKYCSIKALPCLLAGTDQRSGKQTLDAMARLMIVDGIRKSHMAALKRTPSKAKEILAAMDAELAALPAEFSI